MAQYSILNSWRCLYTRRIQCRHTFHLPHGLRRKELTLTLQTRLAYSLAWSSSCKNFKSTETSGGPEGVFYETEGDSSRALDSFNFREVIRAGTRSATCRGSAYRYGREGYSWRDQRRNENTSGHSVCSRPRNSRRRCAGHRRSDRFARWHDGLLRNDLGPSCESR